MLVIAGVIGWAIGHSGNSGKTSDTSPPSSASTAANSLISYALPDGWTQSTCPASTGVTYIIPGGASLDCTADPSAPVKITTDPQNTTDCNQLRKVEGVRKHTCISLYIDGHKSLKSFTQTSQSSAWDYYINTGKDVVKLDYTYGSANNYQSGFEDLINTVKVKS